MFFIFLLILSGVSIAQDPFAKWEEDSKTNKGLLPMYGHLPKSEAEIKNDSDFINKIMVLPQFKTRREASNHMINLGFQYYYRSDFKTAMYRFNQAYLLDTTNAEIFWGYGAIYMAMGQFELAKKQYEDGLKVDPGNTHLMTDLATYYLQQFYVISDMPKNDIVPDPKIMARTWMDSAIFYLKKSYTQDPLDVNTVYKLSICYWNIDDCKNAWTYYDEAMALGGKPVTASYTSDLKKRCKRD
jgi:tetratricopeptide (TPR) repeat protein